MLSQKGKTQFGANTKYSKIIHLLDDDYHNSVSDEQFQKYLNIYTDTTII